MCEGRLGGKRILRKGEMYVGGEDRVVRRNKLTRDGKRERRASICVHVTGVLERARGRAQKEEGKTESSIKTDVPAGILLPAEETRVGRSTSEETLEAPLRAVFVPRGAEIRAEASHPTLSSGDNNYKYRGECRYICFMIK